VGKAGGLCNNLFEALIHLYDRQSLALNDKVFKAIAIVRVWSGG